jgi:hypothetical protein
MDSLRATDPDSRAFMPVGGPTSVPLPARVGSFREVQGVEMGSIRHRGDAQPDGEGVDDPREFDRESGQVQLPRNG